MSTNALTMFMNDKILTKQEAEELAKKFSQQAMMLELCGVSDNQILKFMESKLNYENNFFTIKEPYYKKICDMRFEYSHSKLFYHHDYLRVFIEDLYKKRGTDGTKLYSCSITKHFEECSFN